MAGVHPPARQASQPAIAIRMYRIVQATGKTQFGGVQDGLFSAAYHSPGVKADPDDAAAATNAAKTTSDPRFRKFEAPNFTRTEY